MNAEALPEETLASRPLLNRDFSKVTPASDDVFRVYRSMYVYDRTPLDAEVQTAPDATEDWTKHKITFNAAYGNERMTAFLFLPKRTRPPLQVVVFFPSARVDFLQSSADLGDLSFVDYVIKSGRAVIYPIYQGMYERQRRCSPCCPVRRWGVTSRLTGQGISGAPSTTCRRGPTSTRAASAISASARVPLRASF